ncbi:Hypothetical protein R9X50_00545100 [Acrodontium crateriforme]|uniref:Homeobox domain-containing protein n=1 Tax=Acrodontium crateriforme TaxID=150365 RepID=A0AAQ3R5Y5_9PEZI|nr:Hypothetical protein R9X50_00545100 [Acrodontium crateriforme]
MNDALHPEHKVEAAEAQNRSNPSYAFLNHSTATLPNNLPPNVDDKPLARQKRKRTSAEDQAVLEAAYQRNPKPDKTARQQLVEQVALGEKEVQIWFQNRRQSSRRKSRPLLPHEVVQYQLSRSAATPSNSQDLHYTTDEIARRSELSEERESDNELRQSQTDIQAVVKSEFPAAKELPSPDSTSNIPNALSTNPIHPPEARRLDTMEPVTHADVNFHASSSPFEVSRRGYLANRRGAPTLPPINFSPADSNVSPRSTAPGQPARSLKKASSFVRLSTSFDGNATVSTKDDTSPSPPRASHAMLKFGESGNDSQPLDPATAPGEQRSSQHRSSTGRSRDSRAWEFWCDKDARSELENKGENEANGSAAEAIGLLRSASGRSILGPLSNKRNSLCFTQQQPQSDAKRPKLDSDRSYLRRSFTSSGRLQGKHTGSGMKPKPKLKYSGSAVSVYIPGNTSDKENWSPERQVVASRERDYISGRKMLEERHDGVNRGSPRKQGHGKANRGEPLPGNENTDPEADPELATFMRGGRKSASLSSEDDLDCVQGLLSLSQGNWR